MGFFKTYRKELVASLILITLVGVMVTVGNVITGNAVKEQQFQESYANWLAENCECTAREVLKCKPGYELNEERRLCGKEITVCSGDTVFDAGDSCETKMEYTNALWGCSTYTCDGTVVALDTETNKWGPVIIDE